MLTVTQAIRIVLACILSLPDRITPDDIPLESTLSELRLDDQHSLDLLKKNILQKLRKRFYEADIDQLSITGRTSVMLLAQAVQQAAIFKQRAPVHEELVGEISRSGRLKRRFRDGGDILSKAYSDTRTKRRPAGGKQSKKQSNGKNKLPYSNKTTLCFHAELDQEIVLGRAATLEVVLSREALKKVVSPTSQSAVAQGSAKKKIFIQAVPRKNFEIIGDDWFIVDPPEPRKPVHGYFYLKPTHQGNGEVWIIFRQDQVSLATLGLTPKIVKKRREKPQKITEQTVNSWIPKLKSPLHQLRIYERQNGRRVTYEYELYSPKLRVQKRCESKQVIGNRRRYVEDIYREIEERWLSNKGDADAFTADLRAFGGHLFDELFPRELQQLLWDYQDRIESIQIISTEPFIPWEIVHLKEPGKDGLGNDVRFIGQMGAVRWLHNVGWPPDRLKVRKGRVLYVIPKYPVEELRLLGAESEAVFLKERFKAVPVDPQPNPVRKLLAQPDSFDLLHFACHGLAKQDNISNAHLMLEGRLEITVENGNPIQRYIEANLSATTVGQYSNLRVNGENQPMIVLNACQVGRAGYTLTGLGGFAQSFLKAGAGAFVGTLWSVYDDPAQDFIEALYDNLDNRSELAEAVTIAREKARGAGDATWLAYVVYGNPHMRMIR